MRRLTKAEKAAAMAVISMAAAAAASGAALLKGYARYMARKAASRFPMDEEGEAEAGEKPEETPEVKPEE